MTCLPPATTAASIRSRRLPGMPLVWKTVKGIRHYCKATMAVTKRCLYVFACPTPMTALLTVASNDLQPCGFHRGKAMPLRIAGPCSVCLVPGAANGRPQFSGNAVY